MPNYRITRRDDVLDWAEVNAASAQDGCLQLGWLIRDCYIRALSPNLDSDDLGYDDEAEAIVNIYGDCD